MKNYKEFKTEELQGYKNFITAEIKEGLNTIEHYQQQIKEAQEAILEAENKNTEYQQEILKINSEIKHRIENN